MMMSGLVPSGTGLGLTKPLEYLASPTIIWVDTLAGKEGQGISISLARPHSPYNASNLFRKVNVLGRFHHSLRQTSYDMGTAFLVVYPDLEGHPELWRVTSSHPRFGQRLEFLRRANVEDVQLFKGALEVLNQTLK